jgi:hypothetical protein
MNSTFNGTSWKIEMTFLFMHYCRQIHKKTLRFQCRGRCDHYLMLEVQLLPLNFSGTLSRESEMNVNVQLPLLE